MDCSECFALIAFGICFLTFFFQLIHLIRLGNPKDFSKKSGNTCKAIKYSFTTAMMPKNKESAYLHLPTYIAGILYHLGTFLSLLLFVLFVIFSLTHIQIPQIISLIIALCLVPTVISGLAILIKRMFSKTLAVISGPDDYISNIVTTMIQLATLLFLVFPGTGSFYYITMTIFFLWLPIGKTRHLMYFFFARYHLGYYYGWRGTW